MKRPLVMPALLAAAVALVVAVPAPALAKGPTSVSVTGPGVSKLTVDHWEEPDGEVGLDTLTEVSGIFGIFGDQFVDAPKLTTAELGPRYELTWYEARKVMVVSYVYPFAADGAWAEVPAGQKVWGESLQGGWWHGGDALEEAMVTLGAPPAAASGPAGTGPASDDSDNEPAGAATFPPDDPATGTSTVRAGAVAVVAVVAAVVVGVGLLVGAVAWLLRRRRTTQPGMTLSGPV